MTLLGTFIDVITASIGAGSWADQTYGSLQHSLPALAPDFNIMSLNSVGISSAGVVPLAGLGGNASLATFGFHGPITNVASQPICGFVLVAFRAHTSIR